MNTITGRGGLPMVQIQTPWSTAEIYLQGACVTHFQLHGESPLLFLSEQSRFEKGAAIRGGIPIIFPWFGKPPGRATQHGFARLRAWELVELNRAGDGSVTVHLTLPTTAELLSIPLDYYVTVGKTLTVELVTRNYSNDVFAFDNCLHTYFAVGDISRINVTGLRGEEYLDAAEKFQRKQEQAEAIRFDREVDRLYVNTTRPVEIHDPVWQRLIRIEKAGSASTVVWNPWIAKAQAMADFGDEEYQRMVCVESGNAAQNGIQLAVGQEARLKATYSQMKLTPQG
ncbi:MAG: D-hexose-6-phosphate mutarotase [Verrucomicrobiae bacterium]|nr:D-hexose-6-phosphate mutarotase [Verrucomicrobiae bacterium]